jgi:hypothetical protein
MNAGLATLVLIFVGWACWLVWQNVYVPPRDFPKYFKIDTPKDKDARRAALPKVVNRLYELRAALHESDIQAVSQQIDEAEKRISVSPADRDFYYRLLGRRDQMMKDIEPHKDLFVAACSNAAQVLYSAGGDPEVEHSLHLAGCPMYNSPF